MIETGCTVQTNVQVTSSVLTLDSYVFFVMTVMYSPRPVGAVAYVDVADITLDSIQPDTAFARAKVKFRGFNNSTLTISWIN
jgi:hypothetical protein